MALLLPAEFSLVFILIAHHHHHFNHHCDLHHQHHYHHSIIFIPQFNSEGNDVDVCLLGWFFFITTIIIIFIFSTEGKDVCVDREIFTAALGIVGL